jgi:hypothetical protein
MQKDWFPFFSMMFWLATKIAGLSLAIIGLQILVGMITTESFRFWGFVFTLAMLALAFVLLVTELVYDLATAEMRRRQSVAK